MKKLKYDVKMTIEFEIDDDDMKKEGEDFNEEALRNDMKRGILDFPNGDCDIYSEYEAVGYFIIDDKVVAQHKEKYV